MNRDDWITGAIYTFILWVMSIAFATSLVDKSWRIWAVEKGVAEYDRATGKWTELPGCPKTEGE